MKWEEYHPEPQYRVKRIKINVECPECGKPIWKRLDRVYTTHPPKYDYECDCGWTDIK